MTDNPPVAPPGGEAETPTDTLDFQKLAEHAKDVLARGYIDSEGFARAFLTLYKMLSPRGDDGTAKAEDLGVDQEKSTADTTDAPCHHCGELFASPEPPEGSIAEMAFDAYDHTGHFAACPDFPRRTNG